MIKVVSRLIFIEKLNCHKMKENTRNFHLNISCISVGSIQAMFAQYLLAQQRLLIDLKECE